MDFRQLLLQCIDQLTVLFSERLHLFCSYESFSRLDQHSAGFAEFGDFRWKELVSVDRDYLEILSHVWQPQSQTANLIRFLLTELHNIGTTMIRHNQDPPAYLRCPEYALEGRAVL